MRWLRERAQATPNQPFLDGYTYKTIYERTVLQAGFLSAVVRGENRIGLCSENSVDMAVMLFALWSLGKEVFLVNPHLTVAEQEQQALDLKVHLIFASPTVQERVEATCNGRFCRPHHSAVNEVAWRTWSALPPMDETSRMRLVQCFEGLLVPPLMDQAIAAIMNTSATTGSVKSVPLRWGQIEAHVKASAKVLGVTPTDNWLTVLPMFHVSGLSIILRTLYNGAAATIMSSFDEDKVVKGITSGELTMVSLVPTVLQRIVDRIDKHALRVVLLGGEFIPDALVETCLAKDMPIFKTYGMTETFAQSATVNVLEHPDKRQAVGKPLPGVVIEVRNPDETGIGEIWLQSPMLMTGYLGKPPIVGFFNTDDMGYLDKAGYLYIVNRRQDIIISGGENIYPKELEDCLYRLPGVTECAVVPKEDERWGQVPILYYAGEASVKAVKEHLSENLGRYKQPKAICRLARLPRNNSGKIMRRTLIDEAADM